MSKIYEIIMGGYRIQDIQDQMKRVGVPYSPRNCSFNVAYDRKERIHIVTLTPEEFKLFDADTDEASWAEANVWWRYATGSNMGSVDRRFNINRGYLRAWANEHPSQRQSCIWGISNKWKCLTEYLDNVVGATTERNVASCLVDLAKQNGITLTQLCEKHRY